MNNTQIISQNITVVGRSISTLQYQFRKLVFTRLCSENLFAFLLQLLGLNLSTLSNHPFPLWFASGTACAYVFMRGYTILPGIWIGSFFAYYFNHFGFVSATNCALIFTGQCALLFWLSLKWVSPTLVFYEKKLLIKFLILSCCITAISSFLLEIAYLSIIQHVSFYLWLHWWLANLNGTLIVGIALITLDAFFPDIEKLKTLRFTPVLSFSAGFLIVVCSILLINNDYMLGILKLVMLWLLFRIYSYYGKCGVIINLVFLGVLLSLSNSTGLSMIFLQGYLCLFSIVGLVISARYDCNLYPIK